jgi:Family of unknown function (DUF6263)
MLAAIWMAGCEQAVEAPPDEIEWEQAQAESEATNDLARPAATPGVILDLNLHQGDRFPLMKTVSHELKQPLGDGWAVSRTSLELLLSVTVEEVLMQEATSASTPPRVDRMRLRVHYHRVRFHQELPGQPVADYDSDQIGRPIPLPAQGYHGLKNNGFDFWLSGDHQILELVGFEQFIDRCMKDVTPSRRQEVRAFLAATSGADGIANFVDDSIGVLPQSAVREGEVWTRTRQALQPVPLHSSTRYTLTRLTPESAQIEIEGSISPSASYGAASQPSRNPAARDVQITIHSGRTSGSCLIDRHTGLPLHSRVEQLLNMNVRLANGTAFDQHKTTVTTIKYFPEQGTQTVGN